MSAPIIFWVTYGIMSFLRPEYSFMTKAISELGSVDAPDKWVWNMIGYTLVGGMISVYSFGLFRDVSDGQGSRWPLIGFVLSGLFMALSGVFPGDFEDRQSTTMLLHTLGSFGSYIFFLVGAFTYPKLMRRSTYWQGAVRPLLLFTWLTILFGAWPFVFTNIPAVGQRLVFFFYLLWVFYTALKLYQRPASAR
nr:DUF998 domain-containing protein [Tunicatimonas sp. TK19036]